MKIPPLKLFWRGNIAEHCAGGRNGRACQVYLGFYMAHAADEIAVCGRDAALALGENAAVTTQTGAAGRGRNGAAGLYQVFNIAGL